MGFTSFDNANDLLQAIADKTAKLPAKFTQDNKEYVVVAEEDVKKTAEQLLEAVGHLGTGLGTNVHN